MESGSKRILAVFYHYPIHKMNNLKKKQLKNNITLSYDLSSLHVKEHPSSI